MTPMLLRAARKGALRAPVSGPGIAIFVLCLVAGAAGMAAMDQRWPVVTGALLGLYFLFAIKVVDQWEKVAVLRLGRYIGLRGPGLVFIVPIVDTLSSYVDRRGRSLFAVCVGRRIGRPQKATARPTCALTEMVGLDAAVCYRDATARVSSIDSLDRNPGPRGFPRPRGHSRRGHHGRVHRLSLG
jgi:hypothetical protein